MRRYKGWVFWFNSQREGAHCATRRTLALEERENGDGDGGEGEEDRGGAAGVDVVVGVRGEGERRGVANIALDGGPTRQRERK